MNRNEKPVKKGKRRGKGGEGMRFLERKDWISKDTEMR